MGKSVLIYVIGAFLIFTVAMLTSARIVDAGSQNSINYLSNAKARSICNSMTSILLSRLADSTDLRITEPETMSLLDGTATYTITEVDESGEEEEDDDEGEDHEGHEDDDEGEDHEGHEDDDEGEDHEGHEDDDDGEDHEGHEDDDDEGEDHEGHEDDDEGEDHEGHEDDDEHEGALSGLIKIYVSAIYNNVTRFQVTYVSLSTNGTIPSSVQSLITARNAVSTSGNLVVDGRNHSSSGSLSEDDGALAIWTTSSYSQTGNSKVGGTYETISYAPSKPGNSNVIKTFSTFSGGYPDSPDEVFGGSSSGFTEGKLKSIAQSGDGGSQYVTNPSSLHFPLKGITYVELSSGGKWQSTNIEGSGILIVHNASGNSLIKNLNTGTFKGFVIADDIVHVHSSIIGAVFLLSSFPSDGNFIGNGNGSIVFSKDAITKATAIVSNGADNYGFGKTRLIVLNSYER
ncbi:MAG: spore wall protein [Ignavibacteria bacterium]|nr:MAG: spore wall protein [Ignavibacteria bacterium]